jgi:hypothetical protein
MQFTVPYMINPDAGNLGGKVGFIFLGTGLLAGIGGWYLFPETKGLSFEKLDELYAMKVSPRFFKKAAAEGLGLTRDDAGGLADKEGTVSAEHV